MKKMLLVAAVFCTVSLFLTGCGSMVDETKTVTLGTVGYGHSPSMTAVAGSIYICYEDSDGLMFKKSNDNGKNWSSRILDTGTDAGFYSSIAISGTNVYISYTVENATAIQNLKFIKSADGGLTWSTAVTVDSTSEVGGYNSIAVYNNTVIISYFDDNADDLKGAVSVDGGTSWSTSIIDAANFVGNYSSAAVDGNGNFFISYWYGTATSNYTSGPKLRVAKSIDSGGSWSITTISDSSLCYGLNTVIRASGNTIYIAYIDTYYYTFNISSNTFSIYNTGVIKVVKSSDSGGSWSTPETVAALTNIGIYSSMGNRIGLAFSGSDVYVSYADVLMKSMNVARSADGGLTWSTLSDVIDPDIQSEYYLTSQLAIVGSSLYAVYCGGDYGNEIVFAVSADKGVTWKWY